jgi:hypothetical protein
MPRYWLTPIIQMSPLRLGSDRIICDPTAEFEAFRGRLQSVHPRLLPMFKASLLLSEEDGLCGSDDGTMDWNSGRDLVFDGDPLYLSHCAEAFLDRLLATPEAAALLLAASKSNQDADWTVMQAHWLDLCLNWLKEGHEVILLREDGV